MSFTQGVDFISDTAEVRRLARNVVPPDFTDPQIQSYQQKEYSYIRTITDKDDWNSSNREFGALQLIETELAACDILMHYGSEEEKRQAKEYKEYIKEDLKTIEENSDTEVAESETEAEVDRTEFGSWNKNPAVPPPNLMDTTPDFEGL